MIGRPPTEKPSPTRSAVRSSGPTAAGIGTVVGGLVVLVVVVLVVVVLVVVLVLVVLVVLVAGALVVLVEVLVEAAASSVAGGAGEPDLLVASDAQAPTNNAAARAIVASGVGRCTVRRYRGTLCS